jgi:predicted Zn-dependent protease
MRKGDLALAERELRAAMRLEDGLMYIEPPLWPQPVRHSLGAVLLLAGRPDEAEVLYREDLRRFPENGWSLRGLARSLASQGRTAEADAVERRFARAWGEPSAAPLLSSRF